MFRKICEGDVFTHAKDGFNVSGSRTALLPDGKLLCAFNIESGAGVNDFTPCVSYSENGTDWSEARVLWPDLVGKKSISTSVRTGEDGRISIAGIGFDIAFPGEDWWSNELGAMKENFLVYSISEDGYHFPLPQFVKPLPGEACENPGGMLIDKNGDLQFVYSPYPTISDPAKADPCRLVLMRSTDGGKTFCARSIAETKAPSQYAEAWTVRLGNGRQLTGAWQTAADTFTDKYVLTDENGEFGKVMDFPFRGQSLALTPAGEDSVIAVYNQRKEADPGVWAAFLRLEGDHLVMTENRPVWLAHTTTRSASSGDFSEWTDFSFGEPHACLLPDGRLLVVFWYAEEDHVGIRYVITD